MPSNDRQGPAGAFGDEDRSSGDLEDRIEYRFSDPGLLHRALTHPSASVDPSHLGGDYERLEFLGDRVLGLVIAEMIFSRFPEEAEGSLARRHAKLVRKETLAAVARDLDLGRFMRLEMGEGEASGRNNPGLLSDACEAVIAALYLDGGLSAVQRFIATHWHDLIEADLAPPSDSKTRLQEWAQGRGLALPKYNEISRSGPPHAPTFTISVAIEGHRPLEGQGGSKRVAEQDAARKLLAVLEGKAIG